MTTIVARLLLFLSSYFPLAVIFFCLFVGKQRELAISILAIGTIGLIGLSMYLRTVQKLSPVEAKVLNIQRRDGEAMSYIVTYVIPFLAIPFGDWKQGLALLVFFLVLAILYVNSGMIHINPMLNLARYHLYEIRLDDDNVYALITRHRIRRGSKVMVIKIGDELLLEKER